MTRYECPNPNHPGVRLEPYSELEVSLTEEHPYLGKRGRPVSWLYGQQLLKDAGETPVAWCESCGGYVQCKAVSEMEREQRHQRRGQAARAGKLAVL